MYKPKLSHAVVTAFLEKWSGGSVRNLEYVDFGFVSTIYSFETYSKESGRSEKLIAKFSAHENAGGQEKNQFVHELTKGSNLTVAEIREVGEVELPVSNPTPYNTENFSSDSYPLTYSFIRWIDGEHFPDLQFKPAAPWVPIAIETVEQISDIDISSTSGWGWFGPEGIGKFKSWQEHLLNSCFDKSKSRLYAQHRDRFEDGFLELETHEYFSGKLRDLVEKLPDVRRCLVHTDFGWDNVLVNDGAVEAVIDWDNAVFGDELYDLVRIGVYAPAIDLKSVVRERWEVENRDLEHFDLRWDACAVHMIVDVLAWYGWSENPASYAWMKARGLELLGEGPPVTEPVPGSSYVL